MVLAKSIMILCRGAEMTDGSLDRWNHPLYEDLCRDDELMNAYVRFRTIRTMLDKSHPWTVDTLYRNIWSAIVQRPDVQSTDMRDRLYSLLAVTGEDTRFKADYNEHPVELFSRAIGQFHAWRDLLRIQDL